MPSSCDSVLLRAGLHRLAARWRAGEFDAAEFSARYFFHWQLVTHGRAFASRKHRHDARPDAAEWSLVLESTGGANQRSQLLDWLERYQFRGVIGHAPEALVQWLRGDWPLILRENIPSPRDILRWQVRGTRAVTVITDWPRAREPVLNKPDAFAFFRHDLEHAYKFFHSPALYAGQCAFFRKLEAALDCGVFTPYFDDAEFVTRFHYLMSDMNTHPQHSRQYLRAILIEYYRRRESTANAGWLSAAAERAIVEVMRAVAASPPPDDGDGQGTGALLRWELTPSLDRLSA